MYIDDGERYVFDGDFAQYILNIGVNSNHISKMKEKKLQGNKNCYYNTSVSDNIEELVLLDKVIGTKRGTIGDSVFDNVRTMKYGDREPSRFYDCFSYLDGMSLEELKESYKELNVPGDPVKMIYYEEDDEYYVLSGNHRTLTAMLIGARYIKAKVRCVHCDFNKKEKYLATMEFYNKYNICQINQLNPNYYEIIFKEDNECFVVSGFDMRKVNKDCHDVIKMLSNEIEKDKRRVKVLLIFPEKIRGLIEMLTKNKRAFQYINKHVKTFNVYNMIINLYDF